MCASARSRALSVVSTTIAIHTMAEMISQTDTPVGARAASMLAPSTAITSTP